MNRTKNQYGINIANMNPSMMESIEWKEWTRSFDQLESLNAKDNVDSNKGHRDIPSWPLNLTPMKNRDLQQIEPNVYDKLHVSLEKSLNIKKVDRKIGRRHAYISPDKPSKESYSLPKPPQPVLHRKMRHLPDEKGISSTITKEYPIRLPMESNVLETSIENRPSNLYSLINSPDDMNTTVIQLESTIVASNTCNKIENAAIELRKMHKNISANISTQSTMLLRDSNIASSTCIDNTMLDQCNIASNSAKKRDEIRDMELDSTLVPYSDFLAEKKKKSSTTARSPSRERMNITPPREYKVKSNDYHKSDDVYNTKMRSSRHERREMSSERRNISGDRQDKSRDRREHDRKMNSPSLGVKVRSSPDLSTRSKQDYVQVVYMREEDVNRLIRKGYLHFYKGKLRYREPTKKPI